jgi:hypothetical protein
MRSPDLRYWTTKVHSVAAVGYATELVVVLCCFGGFRAGKTLTSRPCQIDAWCGCLSVWSCSGWTSFFACVLSPYISSGVLPMSPLDAQVLDAQVFVMCFSGNERVCSTLLFPSCSTKPWKWGRRGMWISDLLLVVPVRS